MQNIKLTIAYDGGDYLGWQKTSMGPSIEETLQEALERILREKIVLQAASRTDAGVHAQGQIVNFFTTKFIPSFDRFQYSLNSLLPPSIVVNNIENAAQSFHPTLDCVGKEYHYSICCGPIQLPQCRRYSWHYPYLLDVVAMQAGAQLLTGTHDFSAFCNFKKNSDYPHFIRTVTDISIAQSNDNRLLIKVSGNNFLYKMVRNIVGTLVYVGRGKFTLNELRAILLNKDRKQAGVTAPACGLSLHRVFY